MKKLMILMFALTLFSCGASKTVRTKEKTIKGNWVLNNINYSKKGDYKVTIFNDASKECFEGSTWKFVPNNNTGVYTISSPNCMGGEREFIFVIQEIDEASGYYDFLLKPKNNDNNIGFRVELSQLSENSMQWKQNLTINGSPFIINMNFTKQ